MGHNWCYLLDIEERANVLRSNRQIGSRGFTLIEIMVAVAIIGILMAVAAPNFRIWLLNSQIHTAAESMQTGLQRAKAEAVMRNRIVEFTLPVGAVTWDVSNTTNGEVLERSADKARMKTVTQVTAPAGATKVAFGPTGMVIANSPTDGSVPIASILLDSSALAPADSKELMVTIDMSGRVRMCDPNAAPTSTRACI